LPIKDYKVESTETYDSIIISELDKLKEKDFDPKGDNTKIYNSMMLDELKYDKRGRLVRAFPTFFMTFIDEGQFVGSAKMSDQYFHYKAVSDIMYNNSRKQASSTLVCELSNVFGSLDDAEKAADITQTTIGYLFLFATVPVLLVITQEKNRKRNKNYYKRIYLRKGVRIHCIMRYSNEQ